MQEFMRMIKKISVEKCNEDLVWSMANLKTVLEGGLEQGCPSLRATKQRLSGGGGL